MIKQVEGIVVSTVDYKESSKIINILTKDEGLIGVFAKGSKKLKSRISSTSNILTYGVFHLSNSFGKIPSLVEVDVIDSFKNIKKDLSKMGYATYLLELSTKVYQHDNSNMIYRLLVSSLKKINEGFDYKVISYIVELKLLEYLGIKPVIDRCVTCDNKNDILTISSYKGGYLCKNCIGNEPVFNIKTLKLIRMFYYVDIDKISKIVVSNNIKKELDLFINDYYERYSGIYLKTKKFIEKYTSFEDVDSFTSISS